MLRPLVLACLLTAAASQVVIAYNCNSAPATIRDRDFYLLTRRFGEVSFPPGLSCEFNAESPSSGFFVEIQTFEVSTATVTIASGGWILFRGSRMQKYQTSITTSAKRLQILFDATGDYSRSSGVFIRVRALDSLGCPPGWAYLYGNCFGTSATSGRLNYADAQKACNSMRSNLLHLPATYVGSIGAFVRMLPANLRAGYTWIGLTDMTASGRFKHFWLSGVRQYPTYEISCASGGSYSTCYSHERCGSINTKSSLYAIYMDNCDNAKNFACSMPPFGTDNFYRVPDYTGIGVTVPGNYAFNVYWIYGIVIGTLFVVGLIVSGICIGVRSSLAARAGPGRALHVMGPAGRVVVSAQATVYPQQLQPAPPQYTALYPTLQPYPTGQQMPPPYEAAAAATNAGYVK